MSAFLIHQFDASAFPLLGHSSGWAPELVWLRGAADVLIGLAFLVIAGLLIYFVRRRPTRFPWIFWIFAAFITSCGVSHLLEVLAFDAPLVHLAGAVKLLAAVVSWAAVLMLLVLLPRALAVRGPSDLEREIAERQRAETKFRALLESAPEAMLIIKTEGEIVLVNSQAEGLFGYPREQLLGRPAEMLVPARFRSDHAANRSGCFGNGQSRTPPPANQDLYGLRRDGSEFPIEVKLSPLETEEGTLICSSIRDITERRRAEEVQAQQLAEVAHSEETLRQQTRILQSILASIGDGVLVADEKGHFLLCNPAAETILAMAPAHSLTDTWTQRYGFYLPDATTPYPRSELPLARAMRGEAVDAAEMYVRHDQVPAGIWTSATARPLRDETGALRGGVVVFRDVTEHKRAQEQLQAYAARLQESNRELQDFASVASHDLQEPLRKVQAFGDRLKAFCNDALGEQGRDYLDRMLNAAGRMRSLIDDLLTFSRVTSKAQPFLPVDLNAVAREVLSDLEGLIQQSAGRVEVGPLPTIDADPMQMRQLLQNLIGNALKFHRVHEPPVITVKAQLVRNPQPRSNGATKAPRMCELRVQDNGIGFDEKYLGRLFHVFQRLHGRSEYEGTGMGLAICRRIAERHGGSITATSTPGQGATFIVRLPVKQLAAAPQEAQTP